MVTLVVSSFQVEVSSPSAELEKTICTNSLYGAAMCSKISTSLYNNSSSGHNDAKQRSLIGAAGGESVTAEGSCGGNNNEFGDWSSDKPRVSSDSEMQTTVSSKWLKCESFYIDQF